MQNEIWKPIPDCNEYYEISSMGRVRRVNNDGSYRLRKLQFKDGNFHVNIYVDGDVSTISVHRTMAKVFLDNPENLPVVYHKNGDPLDNRIENLAWGTRKDVAAINPDNLNRYKIKQYKNGILINTYDSYQSAADAVGVFRESIRKATMGCVKTVKGYEWRREKCQSIEY